MVILKSKSALIVAGKYLVRVHTFGSKINMHSGVDMEDDLNNCEEIYNLKNSLYLDNY